MSQIDAEVLRDGFRDQIELLDIAIDALGVSGGVGSHANNLGVDIEALRAAVTSYLAGNRFDRGDEEETVPLTVARVGAIRFFMLGVKLGRDHAP